MYRCVLDTDAHHRQERATSFMLNRFEQFSSTIFGIYRQVQRIERETMEKCGYKGAFAQYLVLLTQHADGLTAARICELCDKDKAAVSRITNEMLEKGLIEREVTDGRVYRGMLKLTEEGRRVAKYTCEKALAAVMEVGKEMTEEERVMFYDTLERISARLRKITEAESNT